MISTGICVTSIAVMFFPGEGQVVFARAVFTLSSIAFELGSSSTTRTCLTWHLHQQSDGFRVSVGEPNISAGCYVW